MVKHICGTTCRESVGRLRLVELAWCMSVAVEVARPPVVGAAMRDARQDAEATRRSVATGGSSTWRVFHRGMLWLTGRGCQVSDVLTLAGLFGGGQWSNS